MEGGQPVAVNEPTKADRVFVGIMALQWRRAQQGQSEDDGVAWHHMNLVLGSKTGVIVDRRQQI